MEIVLKSCRNCLHSQKGHCQKACSQSGGNHWHPREGWILLEDYAVIEDMEEEDEKEEDEKEVERKFFFEPLPKKTLPNLAETMSFKEVRELHKKRIQERTENNLPLFEKNEKNKE